MATLSLRQRVALRLAIVLGSFRLRRLAVVTVVFAAAVAALIAAFRRP